MCSEGKGVGRQGMLIPVRTEQTLVMSERTAAWGTVGKGCKQHRLQNLLALRRERAAYTGSPPPRPHTLSVMVAFWSPL